MTTFALVHGAWHGPWCWNMVTPLLQQAGHRVVTPELPSEDGSADFDAYADVVCAALHGVSDDVVVVGHSLGGTTATFVAARRPVRHLVYLCAVVPQSGVSFSDQAQAQPDILTPEFANGRVQALSAPDEQGRTAWIDLNFVRAVLYADCDEATTAAAIDHLRLQAHYPWTVPCPLTEHPSVSCTSVACSEDRVLNPDWSKRTAQKIGAEFIELPGSHSPSLSRPQAVADILLRIAEG